MGTQQILLIVLSVIIVGVAVAVGIQMFNTQAMNSNRQAVVGDLQTLGAQAMNSNRQAVVGDLQTLGAQVMQYYRTPSSQGGGGSSIGTGDAATVATFIGWSTTSDTTDTGSFVLTTPSANTVRIVGTGTETGNDGTGNVQATLTVTCTSSSPLSTTINN